MTANTGSPRPRHLRRRRHRLPWAIAALAIVVPVGLLLAVRGGGDEDGTGGGTGGPGESTLPLLGTPGDRPDRPALAVKIDDTAGGRPQRGLLEADVVFEELVEGGLTRLMAVYHSGAPDEVGPVRSARSTDIALLAELGRPLFAWSGANPTFAAAVGDADIVDVGVAAVPDAYRRDNQRRAPYDLFASPEDLWTAGRDDDPTAGPPAPLFTYRPAGEDLDPAGSEPVAGIATVAGAAVSTDVRWEWDPGAAAWARSQDGTPHTDDEGTRVTAANVVVRATDYRDSGVRDVTGAVVPEAVTVGEGDAWLLSDGRLQRGRWSKAGPDDPTTYTAADGTPLRLTPGRTWIEVLPPGAVDVVAAGPAGTGTSP